MEQIRGQGKTELAFKDVRCCCQQREQEWPRDGSSQSEKRWIWALLDPGRQMHPLCLAPCSGTFAVYKQSCFRTIFWTVSLWGSLVWGKAIKSSTTGWCAVTRARMPSANPFQNCQSKLTSGVVSCCEALAGSFSAPFWAVLTASRMAQPQAAVLTPSALWDLFRVMQGLILHCLGEVRCQPLSPGWQKLHVNRKRRWKLHHVPCVVGQKCSHRCDQD